MKASPPQEEMNPYIVPNSQTMFDHNEADTTERTHQRNDSTNMDSLNLINNDQNYISKQQFQDIINSQYQKVQSNFNSITDKGNRYA